MDSRSMSPQYAPKPDAKSPPCGFTVCELLVVIACIGILLALLLPAVIYARESSRRVTCCSHLRELGVAVQAFHNRERRLPAAWRNAPANHRFIRGWATELLPELGEGPTADRLRSAGGATDALSQVSLPLLLCPSDITEPTFDLRADDDEENSPIDNQVSAATRVPSAGGVLQVLPTASYVGVFGTTEADEQPPSSSDHAATPSDGTIVHDRRVRIADLERGTSRTLLVGERTMAMIPSTWLGVDLAGEDAQCRLVGSAITQPNCDQCDECEFSSRHSGGANFLWADGHVELMDDTVETAVYRQYSQRFIR